MLKKITELLGEELSKQVQEKLGDVELAIMNDGTVVPAEKHETLKADFKKLETKYQTDISDVNTKLDDALKKATDYDTLKGELDTVKQNNVTLTTEYEANILKTKLDSAIDVGLLKANADEKYVQMLKTQINKDNLKFEGDNLIGLTDSITNLQTEFPKMFGEIKKTGTAPGQQGQPAPVGKRETYISKYNEAMKAGNRREAIRIKQEAFNEGEVI